MIPVQNIYHMLAYAYRNLARGRYEKLASEYFENTDDLLAAILVLGVQDLVRQGLGKDYVSLSEDLAVVRGRVIMNETMHLRMGCRNCVHCEHDEFLVDSPANRIIKASMQALLDTDIPSERKNALRKLLRPFASVGNIQGAIDWRVQFVRPNPAYATVLFVCRLVIDGLLPNSRDGGHRTQTYSDDQPMHRLYERFILGYYQQEHPYLRAYAPRIPWALDEEPDGLLPVMQSDVVLRNGNRVLIVDAKYYGKITSTHFRSRTLHSSNLYQIYCYVKNQQAALPAEAPPVAGLLLYALPENTTPLNVSYVMGGNPIGARTLDLNRDFGEIRRDLDAIVGLLPG